MNMITLENISRLIQTFDTGVTEIKTKQITIDEMSKMVPAEVVQDIFSRLKAQMQMTNLPSIQMTWRLEDGFFNIRIKENSEPEITTLVLKHGKSVFDFSFSEESDGTKRLFDLIDMLLTDRPDAVFVVDELDRFKERYDKKLSKAYLEGRYGAIPVFQQFAFQEGE